MKILRLIILALVILQPFGASAEEAWALKSWNSQNGSNIQALKQGRTVTLLLRAIKPKDMPDETIKKSILVGKYMVHLYSNNAVVCVNPSNGDQQLLIGEAKEIYTIDANTLGFDLDDNCGYALKIENGTASPIVDISKQLVRANEVRPFYDKKDKTKKYDISKYVGDMRDYFKNLRKGAFAKAYKNRQDILMRANKAAYGIESDFYNPHNPFIQALYPIWPLADALFNCRPAENTEVPMRPDYYTALSEVYYVVKTNVLIAEANQFLSNDGHFSTVEEIRSIVEKAVYDLTFKEDTEEAYDRLLANITDNGYIRQATIAREKVAYNTVYHAYEFSECERYLRKYPNVDYTHYAEIIKMRNEIAYAKLDYTESACKEYLEKYPDSYYTSMVKERLYKCAYHDMQPTSAACERYIKEYPESPFINDVRNNLYKYAFQEMKETLEDCEAYLEKYPESPYCDEIRGRKEALAYNEAVEMDDVDVYTKFLEDYPFSIYSDDVMTRKSRLLSNAYAEESSDYEYEDGDYDPNEIVWDYTYDDEDEAPAEGTTTKKRATRGTGTKKRPAKTNKRTPKAKPNTTQKPATTRKSTNNTDASKKANSLIFGPDN